MAATATSLAAAVNAGASARPAVEAALAACAGDRLNAILRLHRERALATADRVEAQVRAGVHLPLAGVPIALKDNLCVEGLPATSCSRMLAGFIAPYTATAVARLEAAGAVIVAQCNMDEFAFGSSNETSCFGPVQNPHDPSRIPGGSSGGSATAVAAGYVPVALGSDTGGSIRQPASLCGVVGMKPTYGRVSRYGLIAFGSSLDQIGPLATDATDAALVYQVMAGADPLDATSAPRPVEAMPATLPLAGLRVGYVAAHSAGLQAEVAAAFARAKAGLAAAGALLLPVELPHERYSVAVYYVIGTGEASSNLARMDGLRFGHRSRDAADLTTLYARSRAEGFGDEVKRRIMLGTYVLSSGYYDAYYKKALQVRRLICQDYEQAFRACDVILGPVSPTTAFKRGEKLSDPLQMYLSDIFTIASNLSGVPSVSVPFGVDAGGLPIGMQLQGPMFSDARLLAIARGLEGVR